MAGASNEEMLASYSYEELEQLLDDGNFLIYEHLIEGIIRDFMRGSYDVTVFKFGILYDNLKEKAKELDELFYMTLSLKNPIIA